MAILQCERCGAEVRWTPQTRATRIKQTKYVDRYQDVDGRDVPHVCTRHADHGGG